MIDPLITTSFSLQSIVVCSAEIMPIGKDLEMGLGSPCPPEY